MKIELIRQISALALLSMAGFEDVRKKSVHMAVPLVAALAGIFLLICGAALHPTEPGNLQVNVNENIWPLLLGAFYSMLPGTFMLLASLLFRGQVGSGDGAVLLALGLVGGFETTLTSFLYGLFLSGLVALFLLAKRKPKNRFPLTVKFK